MRHFQNYVLVLLGFVAACTSSRLVDECGGPGQPACPVDKCGGPGQPACPVDERSCLELPVDECEARGCSVMLGHVYDSESGCHMEEEVPVFCRPNNDIICVWGGDPIILTDAQGGTWYIPWSCFTTPGDWGIEHVPGGTDICE